VSAEPHPAVALALHVAATLASDDGKGVDYVDVRLRRGEEGPTRAQLEVALGPARETPRMPGPTFHRLAFQGPAGDVPVSLFADIDDETGRTVTLTARRDEL